MDDLNEYKDSEEEALEKLNDFIESFGTFLDEIKGHKMSKEEYKIFKRIGDRMVETQNIMKTKMLEYYKGKSIEEMKAEFRNMDDSILEFICNEIAIDAEMYEICQAVKEVIEEKKLCRPK